MRTRPGPIARLGLVVVIFLGLAAPPASAADEEKGPFHEPGISYLREENYRLKPYIDWAAATLIIVASIWAGIKNPHRTHLD
jgi:hypothetical protein